MRGKDADASLEGTAIRNQFSAEIDTRSTPAAPPARGRGGAFIAPEGRRFSPLTARQREGVDIFLHEARPWALRQAKRTYRHLPAELQEQAIDDAMLVLRSGAGASDRRALYGELAETLDESLRRVHVGWCLSQAPSLYQGRPGTQPERGVPTPPGEPITRFIEDGLGGLERAVLQLEIGAGRDSNVVRAALKLGPRQYARHRENGLAKMRGAIAGQLAGRVCEQHLDAVTLAATGDRSAGDDLAAGRDRCRSCAREAGLMRRVLHERLAMAPWPLAIKPAGLLAAKLAGMGAVLTGTKTIGSGSIVTSGASAGATPVLATVLAASVIATAGIATTGIGDNSQRADRAGANVAAPATRAAAPTAKPTTTKSTTATTRTKPAKKRGTATRSTASSGAGANTATAPTSNAPVTTAPSSPASTKPATSKPTKPVTDKVKDTVKQVTDKLPPTVTVPGTDVEVQKPDITGSVDQALNGAAGLLGTPAGTN